MAALLSNKKVTAISRADADALVAAGKAFRHSCGVYETKAVEQEEDDDIPVAPVYETKVMAAETPKRRGRPPKVAQ